jgi:hypothetical protein
MSDRPTPETRAAAQWSDNCGWSVDIDFARRLERQRDELLEALELIIGKNSMLRSYTAEEAAQDAKQAIASVKEGKP